MSDVVVGEDGLARPTWAARDPLLREYYDNEWGMPIVTESGVFERLTLEAFQSGLAWRTILAKRPAFREVFANFDPQVVAAFGPDDVERLMGEARIVRNRRKIEATLTNARATLALREDPLFGSGGPGVLAAASVTPFAPTIAVVEPGLAALVWSFRPAVTPQPRSYADLVSVSPESTAMAKELKRRGFAHVGPTTAHSLMEAIGVIDTHLVGSHRRGSSGVWPR